jgi:energy-converting hydrogenase Eha subunit H
MTRERLRRALIIYGGLAAAGIPLDNEQMRLALWVFLGGLAVKSVIAHWKYRSEQ